MQGTQSIFEITLSFNQISGPLPVLPALQNLAQFSVDSNSLQGSFPSWPLLPKLALLTLSLNSLSGALPLNFWESIPYINVLDLSCNLFSGSIPAPTQIMAQLSKCIFANNTFTGSLPANERAHSAIRCIVQSLVRRSALFPLWPASAEWCALFIECRIRWPISMPHGFHSAEFIGGPGFARGNRTGMVSAVQCSAVRCSGERERERESRMQAVTTQQPAG